jgi:hypothetical protein
MSCAMLEGDQALVEDKFHILLAKQQTVLHTPGWAATGRLRFLRLICNS